MTVTVEEIGKHLGKTIEDSMGRPAGKFVGLTADVKDEVTAIQVARNNGAHGDWKRSVFPCAL